MKVQIKASAEIPNPTDIPFDPIAPKNPKIINGDGFKKNTPFPAQPKVEKAQTADRKSKSELPEDIVAPVNQH